VNDLAEHYRRVFYFEFAVLLYDMGLLVDLLIQVNPDIERRLKPRVPARTFLNIVRKDLPVTKAFRHAERRLMRDVFTQPSYFIQNSLE
jgi:hypothetical protein